MKKSDKTRYVIIEKAAVLFNQKGFNGTSMSDIMEATSISKGGIYGNFKRDGLDKNGVKEEIAVAAFEHAVARVYEEIGRRTQVIENTIDKLKAVVYFYKERVLDPPVEGGCPIQNTAIGIDDTTPILRDRVYAAMSEWHKRVARTVEKGMEKGEIRPDAYPGEVADLFIGMIEGGILLSKITHSKGPFESMSKQLLQVISDLKPIEKNRSV